MPDADGIAATVAENLRRLRAARGWSLEELAQASGVSRAMLNQVETGKSVPTIATLWKIAQGLGVPFQRLLAASGQAACRVLRRRDAKVLFNADGSFASRALFPFDDGPRSVEFYELSLTPGGSERAAPHALGTREQLVVVRGRLEVEVDGARHALGARDAISFRADVPHAYRNLDQRRPVLAYLVMIYAEPIP
ncbi:MAG: XRE family transcriptional regulator [Planctomycetota bacterium]|nr:XRE family transcriptional regulator [Planctomycetota bacterium]MCX8039573.1 XRE family transcriptional regulator [Planctomycetota bacterium]MDW8373817.1 XRE family transcriptional regulator [Planctomycetota bacterium]